MQTSRPASNAPKQRDHANSIVQRVDDVQVARGVNGHRYRPRQLGASRRSAIARIAACTIPRHRLDDAGEVQFSDPLIAAVSDVDVVARVHGQPQRYIELGRGPDAIVTAVALQSVARHGRDDTVSHAPNPPVSYTHLTLPKN